MSLISLLAALVPAATTINPASPGVAVRNGTLQGLPLCVWNDSAIFTTLRDGMRERGDRVFRFPNGSYSDTYHWNGKGTWTADSTWVPDASSYLPGWKTAGRYRGISTSTDASLITDGDTSTFWWSNPEHPAVPGWVVVDLGQTPPTIDSIALWLGPNRPDSLLLQVWTGQNWVYPPPYMQADGSLWSPVARIQAGGRVGWKSPSGISPRYVGIRPLGPALEAGWQMAEFMAFKAGKAVTVNSKAAGKQTQVYAVSTHPGSLPSGSWIPNWDFEAYMKWIQSYPDAIPMVCVNYGTGTPQEAAAWVRYANKVRNFGIRHWQIGNEMTGQWEENGCVSARQYATRFVEYAKAMKSEDPSILVEGPVLASADFSTDASGEFDGKPWLETFLRFVDSAERSSDMRLLDGVDFHTYAFYWGRDQAVTKAYPGVMMDRCDGNGAQFDSLTAIMARSISDPTGRDVLMSEFNTSTVSSSLEMASSAGAAVGLQLAHFIQRFGDRGITNTWELNSELQSGPDNTFGTLGVFTRPTQGEWTSLEWAPNASFWSTRTIVRQWLDTAGKDTIVPVDPVDGLRLFGVRNSGRVSILAFNLTSDSVSLTPDPALFPAGGDVLSWGQGEYRWIGNTEQARAIPNNGPSSRSFVSGGNPGSVKVPPYGMAVVRGSGRPVLPLRTAYWQVGATSLTTDDTLVVSGWSEAQGGAVKAGAWSYGSAVGDLLPTDGSWDGPCESWVARIPAKDLPSGTASFKVSVADARGAVVSDSVQVEVTGSIRPVLLISDFSNKKPLTTWGAGWYGYGSPANTGEVEVDSSGRGGNWFLRDSMSLVQQDTLTYTYQSITFPAPKNMDSLDNIHHLVGIVFDISTKQLVGSAKFTISADLPAGMTGYNSHGTSLPNTKGAWVRDTVLFSDLSQQAGWGTIVAFDIDSLQQVAFRANTIGTAVIKLDNVAFLGTKGESIWTGVRPKPHAAAQLAVAGSRLAVALDGPWVLRLFSANGQILSHWEGRGNASLALPRLAGTGWALLEGAGVRRVVAVPPVSR